MPARVVFVQKIGSGHPVPEGIAEYSDGVIISTKADISGYGFANVGILLDDDTFSKLALSMIEANTKKAVKAFEAAIQACIEQRAAAACSPTFLLTPTPIVARHARHEVDDP